MTIHSNTQKRHMDTGTNGYEFKYPEQWVICSNCGEMGKIISQPCPDCGSSRLVFRCLHCAKSLDNHQQDVDIQSDVVKDVIISSRCDFCGTRLNDTQTFYQQNIPHQLTIHCTRCKRPKKITSTDYYTSYHYQWHLGQTDFGLYLALVEPTRWGTLYFYNPQHLYAVKAFIEADLRERTALQQHYQNSSYFSRLPHWIKSAKHRTELLHTIARLESKIQDLAMT